MDRLKSKLSRRDYVKMSLLSAGSLVLPGFATGQKWSASKPKLNIALVGGGGIARTAFKDCQLENVVAIADVDDSQGAPGFNAFPNAKK